MYAYFPGDITVEDGRCERAKMPTDEKAGCGGTGMEGIVWALRESSRYATPCGKTWSDGDDWGWKIRWKCTPATWWCALPWWVLVSEACLWLRYAYSLFGGRHQNGFKYLDQQLVRK